MTLLTPPHSAYLVEVTHDILHLQQCGDRGHVSRQVYQGEAGVCSQHLGRVQDQPHDDLQEVGAGSEGGHALGGTSESQDLSQSHGSHVNTVGRQEELSQLLHHLNQL